MIQASQRIQPENLEYLGAFRLPEGPDGIAWEYSGQGLAFCDSGDPDGPDDGYPGSLFGIGHDWNTYVSEISIPVPVISPDKNPEALNLARTLQPFSNVRSAYFDTVYLEQTRAGIAYLPPQGLQTAGKLYTCFAAHMGEGDDGPCHGWCGTDLSNPQSAGPWRLGNLPNYVTSDYIFEIPESWSREYTPEYRLATGRFRDGGQGAQGPSLIAYGPWNSGNPPTTGSTLDCIPLLLYGDVTTENSPRMNAYHHSDEWAGGAWLTSGEYSAVIFTGTKGEGNCWYGLIDGTVWEAPYPTHLPDSLLETRGWWSERFTGQILFYDTGELAQVALGKSSPWTPQPYAVMNIDSTLYHIGSQRQKSHIMACVFDRLNERLYLIEPLADGDRSLIHVWKIRTRSAVVKAVIPSGIKLLANTPNPFNETTRIHFIIPEPATVTIRIFDITGQERLLLYKGFMQTGIHHLDWQAGEAASGIYFCILNTEYGTETVKMILMR